ncbi:MAG: hypothetical protein ABIJ59_01435 [Pseudomonadota bacterium]
MVSDGCFLKDGSFQTASMFMLEDLEEAFQHEVLKMLKKRLKIFVMEKISEMET